MCRFTTYEAAALAMVARFYRFSEERRLAMVDDCSDNAKETAKGLIYGIDLSMSKDVVQAVDSINLWLGKSKR